MERKNMDIKPIETYYNGYRFRSRLEARWVVFFDAMGIKYEYEPEGFAMSDGTTYLPDFYLPESKQYFEVKGVMTDTDLHKIKQFIKESEHCVTIGYADFHFITCNYWGDDPGPNAETFELSNEGTLFKCRTCGRYWFMDYGGLYHCQCCGEYDGDHHLIPIISTSNYGNDDYRLWINTEKAKRAIAMAKQARFEHGETPQVQEVFA
jgi:hypothetical protein